jgi:hypothetical protein
VLRLEPPFCASKTSSWDLAFESLIPKRAKFLYFKENEQRSSLPTQALIVLLIKL